MSSIQFVSLLIGLAILPIMSYSQDNPLKPCPSSPNCFRSDSTSKNIWRQPLSFDDSILDAQQKLSKILSGYKGASLEKTDGPLMHFIFVTRLGKFTDDVLFHFDSEKELIHFRSSSRVGWSDLGANKRRMKRIKKLWQSKKV